MSLDLVGKDTLNSIALELFGHLLNYCGHLGVGRSQGNLALRSLEGVPCGQDHISLAACDCTFTNDDSCGSVGGVAIEVGTADATQRNYYPRNVWFINRIGKLSVKKRSCQESHYQSF